VTRRLPGWDRRSGAATLLAQQRLPDANRPMARTGGPTADRARQPGSENARFASLTRNMKRLGRRPLDAGAAFVVPVVPRIQQVREAPAETLLHGYCMAAS